MFSELFLIRQLQLLHLSVHRVSIIVVTKTN